jgi:hypothetical protein
MSSETMSITPPTGVATNGLPYSIAAHTKRGVVTSDTAVATRGTASLGSHRLVLLMGFGGIEAISGYE